MGPGLSLTHTRCASSTPCGSDAVRPPSTPAQLGAVGVTLTAASRVIFMEPDLSAAVEEQALSRVRRMGGGEDVWAKRLVYKGTIEEDILGMRGEQGADGVRVCVMDGVAEDCMPTGQAEKFIEAMRRSSSRAGTACALS